MTAIEQVRERILSHGLGIASAQGLHALSMGDLARDLDLSKNGLFAHFASKESLQLGVLQQAAAMFVREVVEPGQAAAAGPAKLQLLFSRWIAWSRSPRLKGGCPFVHASAEADALPAPVRAELKSVLDGWTAILSAAIDEGKAGGHFGAGVSAEEVVFELYGLYLGHHFWHWSMKEPQALPRTMRAFDRLVASLKS